MTISGVPVSRSTCISSCEYLSRFIKPPGNLYGSIVYVGGSVQQPLTVQSTMGASNNSHPLNGTQALT
jgi:hypothetical protein